eukprot:g3644.t1
MRSLVFASVWATSHAAGVSAPWASASCQAAPGCAALELQGECCPNPEGVTLDCCQLARCSSHPQCASLGLGGDCCPNTEAERGLHHAGSRRQRPDECDLGERCARSAAWGAGGSARGARGGSEATGQNWAAVHEAWVASCCKLPPLGSRIGFLLLLICVPGLCCWFCWIKVLNKGDRSKARSLPEIVDMESVSGVSTRTEPTVSQAESSACQVQSEDLFATRELKEHDGPMSLAVQALRYDSRLNARRASGAVGRLAAAEAMEQRTGRLEHEVADLQQQLRLALDQGAELRVKHQRSEEAEQHAVLRAGEVLGELKASEAMSSGQQARLKDLEVQLLSARDSLAQAEHDRANHSSWTQRLGHELADARANEQEARLREAQQGQELRDAQRRLEQLVGGASTPGELARCQKRLAELEQVCSRQEAELAEERVDRQAGWKFCEERRARERCHLEAVKSGEKLRLARAQGAQMKERVKSLEEAELRYPSRFPPRSIKNLRLGSARSASLPAEPRARGTGHRAQGVPWEPRTAGRAERQVNEPVAKEARWSWEEQPRAALPQAEPQVGWVEPLNHMGRYEQGTGREPNAVGGERFCYW